MCDCIYVMLKNAFPSSPTSTLHCHCCHGISVMVEMALNPLSCLNQQHLKATWEAIQYLAGFLVRVIQ